MVRNRRGIAFTLPPRRVHSLAVRLSPAERRLYDDVTDFVRDAYWSASGRLPWTARLTLIVLQREIGSSTFAVAETLRRLAQSPLFRWDERERLEALRQDAAAITSNVRAGRRREFLKSVDEKVLIFTQYLRTLQYLQGVLEADGHRVAAYHGGLSPAAKDAAVRAFRGDADIFLSTEAGGEGRNLQFSRTVVNYDLPWNPLRIEQRIGRVHRLGQEREVHVVNVWAEDTVEAYLIELLDRKIHMFELVVGELDLILGNLEARRPFEDLMMDIWVLRQAEERRAGLPRPREALVQAPGPCERVKEKNDDVPRDVGAAGATRRQAARWRWVSFGLSVSGFGSESGVRPGLLAIEDGVLLLFGFRVTLVSDEKRESFHLIAVSPVDGSAWAVLPDPEDPRLVPDAPIDFHPDLEAAYRFAIEAVRDETRAEVDRFRSRSLGLLEEEVRRVFAYFDNTLAGIREADPEGSQDLLRAVMAERDRRLAEAVERFDPKAMASLCSVRAVFSPSARVRLEFQGGATADINLDAWSRRLRGLVCGICHGTEGPWSFEAKRGPRCGRCVATGEESAPPRVRPPSDTPRRGTKAGRSAVRSSRGSRARSRAASAGDRGP